MRFPTRSTAAPGRRPLRQRHRRGDQRLPVEGRPGRHPFLDKPPPGQKYDTRRIDASAQTVETAAPAAAAPSPQCTTAQQNLALLSRDVAVQQDTDGDGKPDKTLGADERAAQKTWPRPR